MLSKLSFLLSQIPTLWNLLCVLSGMIITLSLTVFIVPNIYFAIFARPQDLRRKYGDWAVVTGGSSGIGRALAERLLEQGVNVVLVALENDMLRDTVKDLREKYESVVIRSVGADLTQNPDKYMSDIRQATEDITVSIVFNNAGFICMDYFHKRSIDQHVALLECNAIAGVRIIHHFYSRMVAEGVKGCICLTSSAVCYMPAPFASMYGASKALLTNFTCSLAIEAEKHGIDVTAVMPSYTHSNFYQKTPKMDVLALLSKFGWTPRHVSNAVLVSVGRTVIRDIGMYAMLTNVVGRVFDIGFLTAVFIPFRDSMAPPS